MTTLQTSDERFVLMQPARHLRPAHLPFDPDLPQVFADRRVNLIGNEIRWHIMLHGPTPLGSWQNHLEC
ncbi:MAG: hypothetical protein ABL901_19550 [Hyphomicrobiaceae bacterium]